MHMSPGPRLHLNGCKVKIHGRRGGGSRIPSAVIIHYLLQCGHAFSALFPCFPDQCAVPLRDRWYRFHGGINISTQSLDLESKRPTTPLRGPTSNCGVNVCRHIGIKGMISTYQMIMISMLFFKLQGSAAPIARSVARETVTASDPNFYKSSAERPSFSINSRR